MKYLSIAIALSFLAACSSPQKLLNQNWKITDVVFIDSLNSFTAQQKELLTASLKKQVQFIFMPDSVYQVRNGSEIVNGKWWLSTDKKTLFTLSQQEGLTQSNILKLKKDNFIFQSDGGANRSLKFVCSPVITDTK